MILLAFICLQVLDLLTTLLFLHNGVTEANPIIRAALSWSVQPGMALALAKIFGIMLATFAWRSGRKGLIWKLNMLFAGCVAWNLVAAFMGHAGA